MEIMISN